MNLDTHLVMWILIVEVVDFIVTRIEFYKEYQFDREIYEKKTQRIKKTRNKVKVVVEDGKASITEKPDDTTVTVEHRD